MGEQVFHLSTPRSSSSSSLDVKGSIERLSSEHHRTSGVSSSCPTSFLCSTLPSYSSTEHSIQRRIDGSVPIPYNTPSYIKHLTSQSLAFNSLSSPVCTTSPSHTSSTSPLFSKTSPLASPSSSFSSASSPVLSSNKEHGKFVCPSLSTLHYISEYTQKYSSLPPSAPASPPMFNLDNSSANSTLEAEDALLLKSTDTSLDLSKTSFKHELLFNKKMTVLTLEIGSFLIGREVASLLRRQTFNMYRSMKLRGIGNLRAIPEHVDYFAKLGVVKNGTHSVTLIPYEEGKQFIKDCKLREIRLEKRKRKSKKGDLLELYLIANELINEDSNAGKSRDNLRDPEAEFHDDTQRE